MNCISTTVLPLIELKTYSEMLEYHWSIMSLDQNKHQNKHRNFDPILHSRGEKREIQV